MSRNQLTGELITNKHPLESYYESMTDTELMIDLIYHKDRVIRDNEEVKNHYEGGQ